MLSLILDTHEYLDEEDPEEEYDGVLLKGSWFAPLFSSKKLTRFTYNQTNLSGEAFLLDLAPYIAKSNIRELFLQTWIEDDEALEEILDSLAKSNNLGQLTLWLGFEYDTKDIAKFSRIKNLAYLAIVDVNYGSKSFGKDVFTDLFQVLQKRDKFAYASLENQKRTRRVKGYTHGSSSLSSTSSSANELGDFQHLILEEIDPGSREEIENHSDYEPKFYFTMR